MSVASYLRSNLMDWNRTVRSPEAPNTVPAFSCTKTLVLKLLRGFLESFIALPHSPWNLAL